MINFVDRWIDKLEGIRSLNKDESLEMIASHILSLLDKDNKEYTIFVTSSIDTEDFSATCENLTSKLPEWVTCIWGGNPCLYPDSIPLLVACTGVVLLEKKGVSKHVSLERITAYIKDYNKGILGFILI